MGRITLTSEVGGDDGEEEEVSLTSLASPSNWQKLDLLALSLTTVTSRRVGAAGGGVAAEEEVVVVHALEEMAGLPAVAFSRLPVLRHLVSGVQDHDDDDGVVCQAAG